MKQDDQVFVWNCCDALEKARERETVLRIASELRERFQTATAPSLHTRAEIDAALQNVPEAAKRAWREQFRNDPAARVPRGIENAAAMPRCSNTEAFLSGDNAGCDGVACPVHTHGLKPLALIEDRTPEQLAADGDDERPDLNDSDDFEVKP